MQKKSILRGSKGIISIYVGACIVTFIVILSAIYMVAVGVRKNQITTLIKIKEVYENENAEKVYQAQVDKLIPAIKVFDYSFTGNLQTFTAPADGVYSFEMAGASGSQGNNYNTSWSDTGGKGAKIVATFTLKKGDVVDLIIGGQGTCTNATANDGTSGGGGGGSFAFKRISSITDTRYQFTKGTTNYETLLAVAGGSGSEDAGYRINTNKRDPIIGYDGQAASYKSPNNFTAYSTTTNAGTTSSSITNVMGISQFISYDAKGSFYTRNSGRAQGGYGGGGSTDDNCTYGGGWCKGTNTYQTNSWSLDTSATGTDGANTGNGYAKITWLRLE